MVLEGPPFFSVHVPRGNDPDPVLTNGENEKQPSAGVGLAEDIIPVFLFRMLRVVADHQRTIEENLFALGRGNAVALSDLIGIMNVPVESGPIGENIHRHDF
jgi:hypothetical protein